MPTPRRLLIPLVLPLLMAGDTTTGRRFLATEHHRLAAREFRDALARDPNDALAGLGLGRALAGIGACGDALPVLREHRGAPAWTARAAMAEAECLERLGYAGEAEAAYLEAVRLNPEITLAWLRVGQIAVLGGDVGALERAQGALHDDELLTALLTARVALEWGGDVDRALRELSDTIDRQRSDRARAQLWLIDGVRWLDVGDPWTAAKVLGDAARRFPHHAELAAYRAEALRRCGSPSEALEALDRPALRRVDAQLIRAVRARALRDLGDPAAADALGVPGPEPHPEWLASAWYVTGDPTFADRWGDAVRAPDRALGQLEPAW